MSGIRQSGVLAWLHLARTFTKMQRREAEHLRRYDLTVAQFDVLAQLSVNQGISQQCLSERLLVTKGNVCGLIDRLSACGLVERRTDPEDRRSNLLFLTPTGQELASKVVPAHEIFVQAQLDVLTPEEQRDLHTLLRRLDRALGPD